MENQNMHDACFVAPLFKGNRKSNGENNLLVVVHDTCRTNKHFSLENPTPFFKIFPHFSYQFC
jgi:hypothetical protein